MSAQHVSEQLSQHDKRIVKLEVNQDSHEKVCALRYQSILEKMDSQSKDYNVLELKQDAHAVNLININKTISSWGAAFKTFLWCVGTLVGIPGFILICLQIIKVFKELI